jgi:recombination protein U
MSGPVKDPLRALQGARSRAQGGRLEEQIEASCALLTEAGRADISKTPEPMKPVSQPNKSGQFRAVYTKKAEPDFKGVMLGGRAVMFEAKSTGTGRLNKDRVLPEQVKKLDSYTALGAHCFIVATFDGLRVYRIPWTVWRSMKQRYGRNYVTEADIKEYAVRFGPGFTPDLLRGIPTMYDINPLSNVSDVLTAFCGMPYGTQPETEEWRAAVYRFNRFMDWTTPERFMLVDEIRREQPNMENPIFSFMGVPITEDSAGKLKEAMKKSGVSALEVAGVCERFAKIARATLDELPGGNKEEEHDD